MDFGTGEQRRAIEAGQVRADLTGEDVFTLMNAAAWTGNHGTAGQADQLAGLTVRGFSPPARTAPAPR
ncbi:hypothetical protein SK854_40725 [Lentzea sp. BCCO 10_0061]|uniref:Transcriptional regulator SbtR-like C-terminal domain-containing protein n=1 Tax=Lentzea sokolovensis TaxID=3095429 RepID=A0ABU4V9L9_9PSEU|nr:hypothetical protein [Lentzea sp. BCCO 10_0061]MDX8148496.1 hypothetical protein [Lentzea sp. BCCO 10_0061]